MKRYCLYLSLESSLIAIDALTKLLRPLFRSFQSTYYLLPRASLWKDTVIVETPNHKYTANDYESLFRDLGFPEGYDMFRAVVLKTSARGLPHIQVYPHTASTVLVSLHLRFSSTVRIFLRSLNRWQRPGWREMDR